MERDSPQRESEDLQRRETDRQLYAWKEKLKLVREFISNVGVPSILVIGFATITAGMYLGYVPSPSDSGHTQIQRDLQIAVTSMTASHEAQTEVLKQSVAVLREMRCDMKPTNQERVRCFRRAINRGSHEPDQ